MGAVTIRMTDLTALGVPAYLANRPGSPNRLLVLEKTLSLEATSDLIAELLTPDQLMRARWVWDFAEPAAISA